MPAKSAKSESDGFTAEERAAMKERAAELRAEGRRAPRRPTGCRPSSTASRRWRRPIALLAERVHVTITENAPELMPKTWYGMPA